MDTLLESDLSISQLQRLNATRLARHYIYWEPETTTNYVWPTRVVSLKDNEFFDAVLASYRPSQTLSTRYKFPVSINAPKTKYNNSLLGQARNGTLRAACDGSKKGYRMSCSFSFFKETTELQYDMCSVHGSPVSSTRAELFGCLQILSVVRDLELYHGIAINIDIGCDNKRSIDVVNGSSPKKKNADYEHEIHHLIRLMRGNCEAHYIKTHQDNNSNYEDLPSDVQGQIRCHHKAQNVIHSNARSYELLPKPLSHQRIFFSSSIGVLPPHPYDFLNTSVFLDAAQKRMKFSPEDLWMIDWATFKGIQKQVRQCDYVIVQKMMWDYNPIQTIKNLYDNKTTTECELCGEKDSLDHFMRCKSLENSQQGKNLFQF